MVTKSGAKSRAKSVVITFAKQLIANPASYWLGPSISYTFKHTKAAKRRVSDHNSSFSKKVQMRIVNGRNAYLTNQVGYQEDDIGSFGEGLGRSEVSNALRSKLLICNDFNDREGGPRHIITAHMQLSFGKQSNEGLDKAIA